jgi:hypothetical protein
MMTFTRDNLSADGLIFVLVEDSTFETIPDPSARTQNTASFAPYCLFVPCSATRKQAYADEFQAAYDIFNAQGFNNPRLKAVIAKVPVTNGDNTVLLTHSAYYGIKLRPSSSNCLDSNNAAFAGIYHPGDLELEICDVNIPVSADTRKTIRHELFHAVQHAYPTIHQSPDWDESWVIEGTASAAELSAATMERSGSFGWRNIQTKLTSKASLDEYTAEDFWIYQGAANGLGLGYLHTIFQGGIELDEIDRKLPNDYLVSSAYWEWIKNQAFERRVNYNGSFFVGTCTNSVGWNGEPDVVSPMVNLTHDVGSGCTQSGLIQQSALTARLFEIDFTSSEPMFDVSITIKPTSAGPLLLHKVYDSNEAACWNQPIGARSYTDVEPIEFRHLLVANTEHSSPRSYRVEICDIVDSE